LQGGTKLALKPTLKGKEKKRRAGAVEGTSYPKKGSKRRIGTAVTLTQCEILPGGEYERVGREKALKKKQLCRCPTKERSHPTPNQKGLFDFDKRVIEQSRKNGAYRKGNWGSTGRPVDKQPARAPKETGGSRGNTQRGETKATSTADEGKGWRDDLIEETAHRRRRKCHG